MKRELVMVLEKEDLQTRTVDLMALKIDNVLFYLLTIPSLD